MQASTTVHLSPSLDAEDRAMALDRPGKYARVRWPNTVSLSLWGRPETSPLPAGAAQRRRRPEPKGAFRGVGDRPRVISKAVFAPDRRRNWCQVALQRRRLASDGFAGYSIAFADRRRRLGKSVHPHRSRFRRGDRHHGWQQMHKQYAIGELLLRRLVPGIETAS